jgi:hypothetical protein
VLVLRRSVADQAFPLQDQGRPLLPLCVHGVIVMIRRAMMINDEVVSPETLKGASFDFSSSGRPANKPI